jgi:hypothetical protein
MTGGRIGNVYFYNMLFDYLPLFNHLRSLYRLTVIQNIIIFISIVAGLTKLLNNRNKLSALLTLALSLFLLVYIAKNLTLINRLFHKIDLPQEYLEASAFIDKLPGKKVYFPPLWSPQNPSMSSSYAWKSNNVFGPSLYTNPFTSLTPAEGIVNFESVNLTPKMQELRYFAYKSVYDSSQLSQLEKLGIKYVILDKYYLWSDFAPLANIDLSGLEIVKKIGEIYIYKFSTSNVSCIPSYGNFKKDYCLSDNPKILVDRNSQELLLDRLSTQKKYKFKKYHSTKYPNFIVDVSKRIEILESGVLQPQKINFLEKPNPKIFYSSVKNGEYLVFVNIFSLENSSIVDNSGLIIRSDEKEHILDTHVSGTGFQWLKYEVKALSESDIVIGKYGSSPIIIGDPVIIPKKEWEELYSKFSFSNIPSLNRKI